MSEKIKQAVIIAGGLGTRLKPFTETNPKPMFPFENKPFIVYLIEQIRDFGIDRVLILVGYLSEKIIEYLGNGERYGVHISYDITPVEYETGKRIKSAEHKLEEEFLFMYCDNYCPINYKKLYLEYKNNQALIQITAYTNRDDYTKNNLMISSDGAVILYDKKRANKNSKGVDIGYAIINRKVLELLPEDNVNFEAYIYPKLISNNKMYATMCEHRYYSVGSWERIELTKEFFKKKKVVFLDRDGTINRKAPKACYIESVDEFNWLKGAIEAIKKLKDNGYFIILITNQPGIARGNLTEERLAQIHDKMQCDLKEAGAEIDKIYYCPHNWNEGCWCRKPNPGMLYMAQRDYSLDLKDCLLIGDDIRDLEAADKAEVKSIIVSEQYTLLDIVNNLLKGEHK